MVQLTLPKNSKVQPGKSWPKPAGTNLREFRIYRWNPDDGKAAPEIVLLASRDHAAPGTGEPAGAGEWPVPGAASVFRVPRTAMPAF